MSLEYVDDVHELVVENKRLKEENEALKDEILTMGKKLEGLESVMQLIRAFND